MEDKITTNVTKGVIISLALIVYGLVIYLTGLYTNQSLQYVQYIFLIAGIVWACTSYAKQLNGDVTFGNIFAHGFKTTAVVIVIMCIYTFVSVKILFPEMIDKIMIEARHNMQAQQGLSDDQIDKALDTTREHFVLFAICGIIIMFAIVGAISSLIGAAISKKNPLDPFSQQPI